MSSEAPTAAEITELLAHWWHRYDEGQIEELRPYLTPDATFRTRTDTGTTDWEEFVRADFQGADEIIYWQVKHRAASPHPLRHMTLNVAVDRIDGPAADFRSYLLVTHMVGGSPAPLPGGVLSGTVVRTDDGLQLSHFELTLDTQDSIPLQDRKVSFDLAGKVAVVTGSTKGIGRAMVQGLAEAGAAVVVSSRKQDLCDQVAAEVAATTGSGTFGRACHVGDWDAIPGFVDAVVDRFGRIDVLVNNAGISPSRSGVTDMTLDLWRKIFAVNLEGPLRMSQCVAPVMRDGGGGSIINIGSMAGYHAGSAVSAYGASKAASLNISRTMAQEWVEWGVRVNVLSPGPFASDMVEGAERNAPGFKDLIAGGTMMNRVAEPAEIVGPVLYLASDASSFVTGDDISVSGGMAK